MSEGDEFGPRRARPQNWNDVFAITAGLKDVPIEEIEQGRLDWKYDFSSSDMRSCGRKNCEQEHANGWIVAIKGRRYVNIGNCCARKYARADLWNEGLRAHRDRAYAEARVTALLNVREEAQRKLHWLDNAQEIDSAIALHASFLEAAKGPLLAEIERRAEKMHTRIERDVFLTEEELETRRAQHSGARVEGEPGPYVSPVEKRHLGDISGLHCFRPLRDPRSMRTRLQRLVQTLLAWTPKEEDRNAPRAMVQAMRDLGPYSNDLNQSMVAAKQFFSEANLRTLMRLEVVRSQGIVAIECDGTSKVTIVRRAHWTRKAA